MHATLALLLLFATLVILPGAPVCAQSPANASAPQPSALVPVGRTEPGAIEREREVLRRARDSEPVHAVFVGDSITQGWEGPGRGAWQEHFAKAPALNLGNSGDRTEHVLWRLQQAPLTRLQPKHVVLLIGTNNLGHGSSTAAETLAGIVAVVEMLAAQCPNATVHVLEVFPRSERFHAMRGDICQINQALRAFVRDAGAAAPRLRLHAIGDGFIGKDGAIDRAIMPDFLHLSTAGYAQWAAALAPHVQ